MRLNDIDVEVIHKNIKNVHLSVYPPDGKVKVSAPVSMAPDTVRVYVISNSRGSGNSKQSYGYRNEKRHGNISTAKAIMSGESVICSRLMKKTRHRPLH